MRNSFVTVSHWAAFPSLYSWRTCRVSCQNMGQPVVKPKLCLHGLMRKASHQGTMVKLFTYKSAFPSFTYPGTNSIQNHRPSNQISESIVPCLRQHWIKKCLQLWFPAGWSHLLWRTYHNVPHAEPSQLNISQLPSFTRESHRTFSLKKGEINCSTFSDSLTQVQHEVLAITYILTGQQEVQTNATEYHYSGYNIDTSLLCLQSRDARDKF